MGEFTAASGRFQQDRAAVHTAKNATQRYRNLVLRYLGSKINDRVIFRRNELITGCLEHSSPACRPDLKPFEFWQRSSLFVNRQPLRVAPWPWPEVQDWPMHEGSFSWPGDLDRPSFWQRPRPVWIVRWCWWSLSRAFPSKTNLVSFSFTRFRSREKIKKNIFKKKIPIPGKFNFLVS